MIKNIFQMILALLVAFCGSLIFIYLHLPLPWLLGSIFATSILIRFQRIPIQSPKLFSAPTRILIGLAIGSAFTPAILNYIPQYTISLLLVVPFTILVIFFGTYYYYKVLKYDLKTSYLGSMPGGVIEMVIIGQELKANTAKITLMQSSRLFFVVVSLPFTSAVHRSSAVFFILTVLKGFPPIPSVYRRTNTFFAVFGAKSLNVDFCWP